MMGAALMAGVLVALASSAAGAWQALRHDPVGGVMVVRPAQRETAVAVLVSGDGGYDDATRALADTLAGAGVLVLGVDLPAYRARMAQAPGDEVYPAADLEVMSQFAQRALGVPAYQLPVLVGREAGAALVYAALAEANPDTFRGAVSVDFCPTLALPRLPGRLRGLEASRGDDRAVRLAPSSRVHGRWVVVCAFCASRARTSPRAYVPSSTPAWRRA